MKSRLIFTVVLLSLLSGMVVAQEYQPAGAQWISKWLVLDLIENNGGFQNAAQQDYIAQGTNGKHTQESISTLEGLALLRNLEIDLPENGTNPHRWQVKTIDVNDEINMTHTFRPGEDLSNITWYGIIVVQSPDERQTTCHIAHDDHAQIWLNGVMVYDNPDWTGAVHNTQPADVSLRKDYRHR
jgi:hypothetical protein